VRLTNKAKLCKRGKKVFTVAKQSEHRGEAQCQGQQMRAIFEKNWLPLLHFRIVYVCVCAGYVCVHVCGL
jgi:hypothetical protein